MLVTMRQIEEYEDYISASDEENDDASGKGSDDDWWIMDGLGIGINIEHFGYSPTLLRVVLFAVLVIWIVLILRMSFLFELSN